MAPSMDEPALDKSFGVGLKPVKVKRDTMSKKEAKKVSARDAAAAAAASMEAAQRLEVNKKVMSSTLSTLTVRANNAAPGLDDSRLGHANVSRIHGFLEKPQTTLGAANDQVRAQVRANCTHLPGVTDEIFRAGGSATPSLPALAGSMSSPSLGLRGSTSVPSPMTRARQQVSAAHSRDHTAAVLAASKKVTPGQTRVGPKSHFGDGDGSYWDRWLTTTGTLDSKNKYHAGGMPTQSRFQGGVNAPRSGFKAAYDAAVKSVSPPKPVPRRVPAPLRSAAAADAATAADAQRLTESLLAAAGLQAEAEDAKVYRDDALAAVMGAPAPGNRPSSTGSRKSDFSEYGVPLRSPAGEAARRVVSPTLSQRSSEIRMGSPQLRAIPRNLTSPNTGFSRDNDLPSRPSSRMSDYSGDGVDAGRHLAITAQERKRLVNYVNPGGGDVAGQHAKDDFYRLYHEMARTKLRGETVTSTNEPFAEYSSEALEGQEAGNGLASGASFIDQNKLTIVERLARDHEQAIKDALHQEKAKARRASAATPGRRGSSYNASRRGSTEFNFSDSDDDDETPGYVLTQAEQGMSPRSRFMHGLVGSQNHLLPRARLMLRKSFACDVNLKHQGIGDDLAILFGKCLQDLPAVKHLNVENNRLHDPGLCAILKAVRIQGHIESLDVSENKVDSDAAAALASLIARKDCSLAKLRMAKADVDDFECQRFIAALKVNLSLTYLDLSNNMIGSDENLNTVQPDLKTGPEELADVLRSKKCRLRVLDLSWNLIRFESAVDLGKSLQFNNSLVELNLSYNAIGNALNENGDGALHIGEALHSNRMLRLLDLTCTNITPKAAYAIAAGLRVNRHLERIILERNPLGQLGGQGLFSAAIECRDQLSLEMKHSNFKITDPHVTFDKLSRLPSGAFSSQQAAAVDAGDADKAVAPGLLKYTLELHKPFERAVALEILRVGVTGSPFGVVSCKVDGSKMDLEVVEVHDLGATAGIRQLALDIETDAERLWRKYDADGSGGLDAEEVVAMLTDVGHDTTLEEACRMIARYDSDGSGCVEKNEFFEFLTHLPAEMEKQQRPTMYLALAGDKSKPWSPPAGCSCDGGPETCKAGCCKSVVFEIDLHPAGKMKVRKMHTSSAEVEWICEMARSLEDASALELALEQFVLTCDQAQKVVDEMLRSTPDIVRVLKKVLPKMADPVQAQILIKLNLSDSKDRRRIQKELGAAYLPIVGLYTGHYLLDLRQWTDRLALMLLLDRNSVERDGHKASPSQFDTSQKSNWENFRNEKFNGQLLSEGIVAARIDPMTTLTGVVEFDYVSTTRPPPQQTSISKDRFAKLVISLGWASPDEQEDIVFALSTRDARPGAKGRRGGMRVVQSLRLQRQDLPRSRTQKCAKEIAAELAVLYGEPRNPGKPKLDGTGYANEEKKAAAGDSDGGSESDSDSDSDTGFGIDKRQDSDSDEEERLRKTRFLRPTSQVEKRMSMMQAAQKAMDGRKGGGDGPDPDVKKSRSMSKANIHGAIGAFMKAQGNQASKRGANGAQMSFSSQNRLKYRKVQMKKTKAKTSDLLASIVTLKDILSTRWFSTSQIEYLIKTCPLKEKKYSHPDLKNWRADLIVAAFARIIDLDNLFSVVINHLTNEEYASLIYRLGWLNVWNPCKPDGFWELNLGRGEERQVAKMLVHLAGVEPGINWKGESFAWSRGEPEIPGWSLKETWLSEDGLPKKGVLHLTYYSGEGIGLEGCDPVWNLRAALMSCVLADPPNKRKQDLEFEMPPAPAPPNWVESWVNESLAGEGIMFRYDGKNPPASVCEKILAGRAQAKSEGKSFG